MEPSEAEYAQRLASTFPLLDKVLSFGLGWSFSEASGQVRSRFYRQRPFIGTLVFAFITLSMAIAGVVTLDKEHRDVGWSPLVLLFWLAGPLVAFLLTFYFRALVKLFPILRTYHIQELADSSTVHARWLNLTLIIPVAGAAGFVVQLVFLLFTRDVQSWPPVVIAGYLSGAVAIVVLCGIALPLAYSMFVLKLLLHCQQVRTLHQLIMERSPDILAELDKATPQYERLLLSHAPEKLRGLRPLRAASTPVSGVRLAINLNPLAALSIEAPPDNSQSPLHVTPLVAGKQHAALDLPSCSPRLSTGTSSYNRSVAVDDVILLHNAVQGSIDGTAKVWLAPIGLIFIFIVVQTAVAAINMINATTGTATPVFAFWLFAGPVILLLFLCPIVTFNTLWPKLMGTTMDWSRWCTNDRMYLLSQLSASNSGALSFSLVGFAMTWPALLKLILPLAAPALISQLLRLKSEIIHPPT